MRFLFGNQCVQRVLAICAALALIGLTVFGTRHFKAVSSQRKEAVLSIFGERSLGEPEQEARRALLESQVRVDAGLHIREWSDGELELAGPTEFGARNWILIMLFQNSHLVAFGIRVPDSRFMKPANAPEDFVSPDAVNEWQARFGPRRAER